MIPKKQAKRRSRKVDLTVIAEENTIKSSFEENDEPSVEREEAKENDIEKGQYKS